MELTANLPKIPYSSNLEFVIQGIGPELIVFCEIKFLSGEPTSRIKIEEQENQKNECRPSLLTPLNKSIQINGVVIIEQTNT